MNSSWDSLDGLTFEQLTCRRKRLPSSIAIQLATAETTRVAYFGEMSCLQALYNGHNSSFHIFSVRLYLDVPSIPFNQAYFYLRSLAHAAGDSLTTYQQCPPLKVTVEVSHSIKFKNAFLHQISLYKGWCRWCFE